MNKLANLVRHASRVEKVWAQFTNTSDQLSHQIGGTQFGKKKKGYPFSSCQIAYPQFGERVGWLIGPKLSDPKLVSRLCRLSFASLFTN